MNFLTLTPRFWIRLASVGEKDFPKAPGGTIMFFLAPLRAEGIRVASIFFAIYAIWSFIFCMADIFVVMLGLLGVSRLLVRMLSVVFGILAQMSILTVPLIPVTASLVLVMKLTEKWTEGLPERWALRDNHSRHPALVLMQVLTQIGSGVVLLLMVLAIELILRWNHVSGVNQIDSPGQVIPFVVGVTTPVMVVWHFIKRHYKSTED